MQKTQQKDVQQDDVIRFRITKEAKEIAVRKSNAKGLSLSTYIRQLIDQDGSMKQVSL